MAVNGATADTLLYPPASEGNAPRSGGPKIAAIGGGTGLATLLRGIKEVTANVTGIVTVADDGGSSGRLRKELGMLPPGDIRNCIVALAEAEPLMKRLFEYRFTEGNGLADHSFGNLFIAAMSGVTGNFEQAVSEASRVLKVTGRIAPSTLEDVHLVARMTDGTTVCGESKISAAAKRIARLEVSPEAPEAFEPAVSAILGADVVVLGPGSVYTSLIPNLLVPGIAEALVARTAPLVYVCNLATQPGETDGYTVADHCRALQAHRPELAFDYVIANSAAKSLGAGFPLSKPVEKGDLSFLEARLVEADLMNDQFRGHHDPQRLASTLIDIYYETMKATAATGRA